MFNLRFIQGLYKVYARFIQGLYKVYTRFIQGLCKVYARFMQGLCKVYTRFMQGLCKVYTRFMQKGYTRGLMYILNGCKFCSLQHLRQTIFFCSSSRDN